MSELVRFSLNNLVYGFPSVIVSVSLVRTEGGAAIFPHHRRRILLQRRAGPDLREQSWGFDRVFVSGRKCFNDSSKPKGNRLGDETPETTGKQKRIFLKRGRPEYKELFPDFTVRALRKLRKFDTRIALKRRECFFILFYLLFTNVRTVEMPASDVRVRSESDGSNYARRLKCTRFEMVCKRGRHTSRRIK